MGRFCCCVLLVVEAPGVQGKDMILSLLSGVCSSNFTDLTDLLTAFFAKRWVRWVWVFGVQFSFPLYSWRRPTFFGFLEGTCRTCDRGVGGVVRWEFIFGTVRVS